MSRAPSSAAESGVRVTYVHQGHEYHFQIGPERAPHGYAVAVQLHTYVWLEEIAVRPEWRGRGIGGRLLDDVIARFGHQSIGLHCCPFVPDFGEPQRKVGLHSDDLLAWYGRRGFELADDGHRMFRLRSR
ncbi:hypothetical protein AQJ30_15585 [Streptomyces longwoodensis]|uniref:N-acetyltransferase domain-containing protein n=1 Tax=Streptomyces longwoodensis TaxID=68231 RepID=A0A117QN86_9ACTN|nr:GNAT family N-acetyltransferase [Streptomyces longwoodensis]KUN37704.1 hypothetical protein AQJ30_15585 [Streptomyces longwoodensis]